jgi:hypothetical protein
MILKHLPFMSAELASNVLIRQLLLDPDQLIEILPVGQQLHFDRTAVLFGYFA